MKQSNIIGVALLIAWMSFTGYILFQNYELKASQKDYEARIGTLMDNINVLRISNYSYEQYFKNKVADGEMIEVISADVD